MRIAGTEIKTIYVVLTIVLLIAILTGILLFLLREEDTNGTGIDSKQTFFGFLFGGSSSNEPRSMPNETENDQEEKEKILNRISSEPVVGGAISAIGETVRYFNKATGHLYENTFTGDREQRISNVTVPALFEVQWTPNKEYALMRYYSDGELLRLFSHFQGTTTIESAFLPNGINELAVSQTNNSIAYTTQSENETTVFTANPDNTGIRKVFSTRIPDFELSWPAANIIALKTKSSAFAPSFLYTLNIGTGRLTKLLSEKTGLDVLWSPSGKQFLAMETSREGTRVQLSLYSPINKTVTPLPFITLPEKCTWGTDPNERFLYCAIPQLIPRGAHLPDDWWQGAVSFDDALWRIDLETGLRQQLLPVHQLDGINLFLNKNEEFLFFQNKKDGLLWSLRLINNGT